MADFILLTHGDADGEGDWESYIADLQKRGVFRGGSAIGDGVCARQKHVPAPLSTGLVGFIRVEVSSLDEARKLLAGHPTYERGGTVEIRELPRT